MRDLDILIPVYRGLDETRSCILSVVTSLPNWAHLIVINDCSPDSELSAWLRDHSMALKFTLIENETNLGFVGSVNIGMMLHPDRDVLLLNSDVEVANSDWLCRMRNAAYSRDDVASLTPFSNNATICSFPNFCQDNELFENCNVTELDQVFSSLLLDEIVVSVPTGVGFCMYIRRDCLDVVGYFDEKTFGKGYGEENDWCQRAAKLGWTNYHQLNVFVYHKGGVSFQSESNPRIIRALDLLQKKHPNYANDIQEYIKNDPAKNARLLAKLILISGLELPKILLVSHCLGGGVTQHLEELSNYYSGKAYFIKVTPYVDNKSIAVDLFVKKIDNQDRFIFNIDIESDFAVFVRFVKLLNVRHIHFHHTMGLHPRIFTLPSIINPVSCDLTVHDYYLVNGNPTLTDDNGVFAGNDLIRCDELCQQHYPIPVSADQWRKDQLFILNQVNRVICPSIDVANRFLRYFPTIKSKTIICPHLDTFVARVYPKAKDLLNLRKLDRPLRVLVLGALSREKGANIFEQVASCVDKKTVEFHLLGYGYRPLCKIKNHGAYSNESLDTKLSEIAPDIIWYPAQWPETYSYTLSIALERGFPVVCSNIGAFIERIAGREYSYLLPWNAGVNHLSSFWMDLANRLDVAKYCISGELVTSEINVDLDFYINKYINVANDLIIEPAEIAKEFQSCINQITISRSEVELGNKEKGLVLLWKLRNLRFIKPLIKLIPFRLQCTVKRWLTRKPIHEILK